MAILVKICGTCGVALPATLENFQAHKGGLYGLRGQCRPCRAVVASRYRRTPHGLAISRASISKYQKSAKGRENSREYQKSHPEIWASWRSRNKDRIREAGVRWRAANPEKVKEKQRRSDAASMRNPSVVLKRRVRARLRQMLLGISGRTEAIVGYSADELRRHIERQFTKGMSWDRLLGGDIQIDHIIPVASFSIKSIDDPDFKACWGLPNLRPMWKIDNQRKQAKILSLL